MLLDLLTQTGTILRAGESASGFGTTAKVKDWSKSTSQSTRYRLQQTSGMERTDLRDIAIGQWVLFLPPDSVISEKDRFVADDGAMFEVVSAYLVRRPEGPHHWECALENFSGKAARDG